jgi:hypothetical protein
MQKQQQQHHRKPHSRHRRQPLPGRDDKQRLQSQETPQQQLPRQTKNLKERFYVLSCIETNLFLFKKIQVMIHITIVINDNIKE